MLKHYLIILFFILGFHSAFTQKDSTNSFTLKGTIVNGDDNTLLIGANILINKGYATNTDNNGEFTIQVNGDDSIIISYIGFKSLLYLIQPHEKGNYLNLETDPVQFKIDWGVLKNVISASQNDAEETKKENIFRNALFDNFFLTESKNPLVYFN